MDRVKGNIVWWSQQLKDLGVDQAALISEARPIGVWTVYDFEHVHGSLKGLVP